LVPSVSKIGRKLYFNPIGYKMNIPILMVNIYSASSLSYSHGLASLAGVLVANGYKASDIAFHPVKTTDMAIGAEEILQYNPKIILLSCTSNQWENAKLLLSETKRRAPDVSICIGGPHVTADPNSVIASEYELYVIGEGEGLVTPIVNNLLHSRYPGKLNTNVGCKIASVIDNLDDLPMPLLAIFDKQIILEYPSLIFSRGCIFECSYCMSRNGGPEGRVRWKSPERAIAEVLDLIKYSQPEELYFDDDTLLKNHKWVTDFCALYKEHVSIPFNCNARPETINNRIANTLRDAGCDAIGIGIESGNYRIRKDILQRDVSDETILRAFDTARSAGLKTWSFNMVGLPTESDDDLNDTIILNDRAGSDFVRISMFTPYPGTPIYQNYQGEAYSRCYLAGSTRLNNNSHRLLNNWLDRLSDSHKLWYTTSELDVVMSNRV
jgi:anaerobic magnesium-protoporphyrin IX monomethyl ester cyclase